MRHEETMNLQKIRTMKISLSRASTGSGSRMEEEGLGSCVIRLDFHSDPTDLTFSNPPPPPKKIKRGKRGRSVWGTSGPSHHYEVFDSQASGAWLTACARSLARCAPSSRPRVAPSSEFSHITLRKIADCAAVCISA